MKVRDNVIEIVSVRGWNMQRIKINEEKVVFFVWFVEVALLGQRPLPLNNGGNGHYSYNSEND